MRSKLSSRETFTLREKQELFEKGEITTSATKYPSYSKRTDDKLVLRAKSLHHPTIFGAALCDYVRAVAFPAWRRSQQLDISASEWQDHLQHSEGMLRRMDKVYHEILTRDAVRTRCIGHSAEFVVAHLIDGFLKKFHRDPEIDIFLQKWETEGDVCMLGGDYAIRPLEATNFLLHDTKGAVWGSREFDMMVKTEKGTAFFMDVSTSHAAVEKKMSKEESPEHEFLIFRQRLKEALRTKPGPHLVKNPTKIHVVTGSTKDADISTLIVDNGHPAVIKIQIPTYSIVYQTGQNTVKALQELGVLQLESSGIFSLQKTLS